MEVMTNISGIELLAKALQDLAHASSLEEVMKVVKKASRKIAKAQGVTFVLREGDFCYYADEDSISPLWKGQRFPITECISGWVMVNRLQAVIEDVFTDNRIPHELYKKTFVRSLAMVPLRTIDPLGAIGCYWSKSHVATREEMTLLQTLADIATARLENIHANELLEQRVIMRTVELEKANKDLESFSYSVSHDLRAPLRGITGFLNILIEDHGDSLNEDAKKLIKRVLQNATDMSGLIEGLLLFFKMGKKHLTKQKVRMKKMVQDVYSELIQMEAGREIEFRVEEIPDCLADPTLLKQVWINLISNAIKYTRHKQKALIQIGSEVKEGNVIYFIRDNGAGFSMDLYEKLFHVFQRLHPQKEFEGTGIGLAIVKKIISRHGGNIWADSRVEYGSTFYFSLE
jgi:signal transduction histidine kinase